MKATWVVLATAVAMVLAVPLGVPSFREAIAKSQEGKRNILLEEILPNVLERLRDTIINGDDIIPPMDPIYIDHIPLDDNDIPLPGAKVDVSGFTVSNLASFMVDDLSITTKSLRKHTYRVELYKRIPELEITADHYNFSLSAMGLKFFGAGDAKITLINPALKFNVLVGVRLTPDNIYLHLLDTNVQFSLEAFEPAITGIFYHDGLVSVFVNVFLSYFVPSLVEDYEPDITAHLSKLMHDLSNCILRDLDITRWVE